MSLGWWVHGWGLSAIWLWNEAVNSPCCSHVYTLGRMKFFYHFWLNVVCQRRIHILWKQLPDDAFIFLKCQGYRGNVRKKSELSLAWWGHPWVMPDQVVQAQKPTPGSPPLQHGASSMWPKSQGTLTRVWVAQLDWPHAYEDPFLWALSPALDSGLCSLLVLLLHLWSCFVLLLAFYLFP